MMGVASKTILRGAYGAVLAAALAGTAAAQPFSDTFKSRTLQPFWTVTSPNSASSVGHGPKGLHVVASYQNGGSDLYAGSNYSGPVVLQPVAATTNWQVVVKVAFSPTDNYQGAGILLATRNGGFTDTSQFSRIAERAYYPAGGGQLVRSVGNYTAYAGTATWLRVNKKGSHYTGWWSADGLHWTLSGKATDTTPYSFVGVFTLRQPWDGVPVDSVADYRFFRAKVLP